MNARQVRLGIDIFTGLVVASVGLALAGLTWRLAGYSGVAPAAAPPALNAGGPTDIAGLLALAPFGTTPAPGDATGDGSIHLKAIFVAVPASASSVLIAGSDGKVASYGIGSPVGGGVIDQIMTDQIVVRKAGGLATIGFAPTTAPAGAGPAAAPRPGQARAAPTGIRVAPPPSAQAQIPSGSPLDAPAAGYRVDADAPHAVFAAGLKPGDVVEQVNGAPVGAGANARDLLAQAMRAGSAQVMVNRAGQHITLTLAVH